MNKPDYWWETSPHTADLAIAISSAEQPGLFHAALDGLLGLAELDQNPPEGDQSTEYGLNISVECIEEALVDFLNECIFILETEDIVPYSLKSISTEDRAWSFVILCREATDKDRKEIGHIKAATYSGLEVVENDGRFSAKIIFDT